MRNYPWSVAWTLLAFSATLYPVCPPRANGKVGGGVRTSFTFQSTRVTLHGPVYIHFSIYNGLAEPIRFDLGANAESKFKFSIKDQTGTIHRVGPLREPPFSSPGRVELSPGKSFKKVLLLNRWYQFKTPGKYRVRPYLAASIGTATGTATPMGISPTLDIDILPRDPKRLRAVCAKLAAIATSPASGVALGAAQTLGYVLDLEAVPFLVKVAEAGDPAVRSTAVRGLARISSEEGLVAVLREAGPIDEGLRSAIERAARNLQHGVRAVD